MNEAHLVALELLVVDERQGVDTDVERGGDLGHGLGLRPPADLGVKEILRQAELLQPGDYGAWLVLARHRVQNAAPVKFLDRLPHAGAHLTRTALEQHTFPHGFVQVPHHALDAAATRRRRRRSGGHRVCDWAGHRDDSCTCRAWLAIVNCEISELPSMISMILASR